MLRGAGHWESLSLSRTRLHAQAIADGLRRQGLLPGQRVCVLAAGNPTWDQVHLGVLGARGVVAGLDTHATAEQMRSALQLVRPAGLFVQDGKALSLIDAESLASLTFIVVVEGTGVPALPAGPPPILLAQWLDRASNAADDASWDQALPDDPAWILFTSGTTGQPRALMYRHHQVRLAIDAILDAFGGDVAKGDRVVSWLPMSNPFQRVINLCALAQGAEVYYVADPREVMRHLPAIRPQIFIAVPRFFEKFHSAVMGKLSAAAWPGSTLARWGLAAGRRWATARRSGAVPNWTTRAAAWLADRLVLARIRSAFGGELRYFVSGSAAMPVWLLENLDALGLQVFEAYGLSECIVPVSANRPGHCRMGTVGQPMQAMEVRMAPDGELLVRSDGLFEGYLGADDGDRRVDADGWLATGDFGEFDDLGYIRLVGRKSEIFKTSTGRRVAPGAVEAALRALPWVEHAAVFGAGRQSLLALVCINEQVPGATEVIRQDIRRACQALPGYLLPAGMVLSRQPFSMESGELTANLKLRRHVVEQRHAQDLDVLARRVDDAAGPRAEASSDQAGTPKWIVL